MDIQTQGLIFTEKEGKVKYTHIGSHTSKKPKEGECLKMFDTYEELQEWLEGCKGKEFAIDKSNNITVA